MDRINGAGHVNHLFVAEDVPTNRPPTEITADWLNGLQEEVVAVLLAAGIAPSTANLTQLLSALRSAGVFQTPAQFDASSRVATTEFVRSAGINAKNLFDFPTSANISLASVGGSLFFNSASAITAALPAANSMPAGGRIECMNVNSGVATIARAGTDTIKFNNSNGPTIALGNGDTVTLESDGNSIWYPVCGSAQLKYSAVFGGSLATSGYKILPGGLIMQWGVGTTDSSGNLSVTPPITFPTAIFNGFANVVGASGSTGVLYDNVNSTVSSVKFHSTVLTGINWLVLGY